MIVYTYVNISIDSGTINQKTIYSETSTFEHLSAVDSSDLNTF